MATVDPFRLEGLTKSTMEVAGAAIETETEIDKHLRRKKESKASPQRKAALPSGFFSLPSGLVDHTRVPISFPSASSCALLSSPKFLERIEYGENTISCSNSL